MAAGTVRERSVKLPRITGTIDRRLLVNFTVDPEVASEIVPAPFRPKLVRERAVAGICLIRLTHVRPAGVPAPLGVTSENAAHRIAVTWEEDWREREGVFIPRRHTSSRLNSLLGGRIFPGAQRHASFDVKESPPVFDVGFEAEDGAYVSVRGRVARSLPPGSVFSSLEEASEFFRAGAVGYSATPGGARFDGLELDARTWHVEPLDVTSVRSSFFEGLPRGAAELDCALIMRGIEHEWRALEPVPASPAPGNDGSVFESPAGPRRP